VQLHHGGLRTPEDLIGEPPVCPSGSEKHGARAMTLAEVIELRGNFIAAALRAQRAGYDGVEVHGAHGYLLTQFLSRKTNQRQDAYGGSLENRARLLFEIVDGIRAACGEDFLLGVRLSPERFGMELDEVKTISQRLIDEGRVDFLDISLWDVFKQPEGAVADAPSLLSHFTALDWKEVRLTVAGKIYGGREATAVLDAGVDFVTIGRSGILHHDFPVRVMEDPDFRPASRPVTADYLRREGLGEAFIDYLGSWEGFVEG
ncbi:MAG: NADH:flavin oxidoreductase, partial [Lewinella sp.]|nr:NADH:flavin oxidoreductase [Lewinella sp.]